MTKPASQSPPLYFVVSRFGDTKRRGPYPHDHALLVLCLLPVEYDNDVVEASASSEAV